MYNVFMSHNSTTTAPLTTQVLIINGESFQNCPEKPVGYRTENGLGYRTANRLGNRVKNQGDNGVVKTGESSRQMETPAAGCPRARGTTPVFTHSISYTRSSWVWLAGIVAKVRLMLQVVVACGFGYLGSTPTPLNAGGAR
mgnify:CR=1 FL=1